MRKTILITGASSGLGLGMAREFARNGHDLILCARRVEALQEVQAELRAAAPTSRIEIAALDVNDHEAVFRVFREQQAAFGQLDRIIVNAGIGKGVAIGKGGFKANRETAMTNFVAALAQCEAAVEIFRAQNAGHLVTISSVSAVRGFRGALTTYAATKAALANLSEGIRVELLHTPIQVSTILPGFILTDINREIKNAPFRVSLEAGCKALVKTIDKEPEEAFVPGWPWSAMARLMKTLPLSQLRKFS
ncbi:MAG: SDR family oxidoreductase [Oceanococcaceae bacterium]